LTGFLGEQLNQFIAYYKNQRYHESLHNVTPVYDRTWTG
jgi:hypothetical protein